ncbi:MAG: hypothetical protein KDD01_22200 [Phaeodactylibacter sp.]|nr:hypothetical protein [Phaeodactylibacter sp.]
MTLKKGDYLAPFWAKPTTYYRGRDPMGLQNSSAVMYSRLLSGMTNVTSRIRYYGFFCWVFREYQALGLRENTNPEVQKVFIRRCELLLSYIHTIIAPDITGAIGSTYTGNKTKEEPPYPLAEGARLYGKDGHTDVYFQNSWGGFGLVYSGTLQFLGLVSKAEEFDIFLLTPEGEALAEAFAKNIPQEGQRLFLEVANKKNINREEVEQLHPFLLTHIPEGTEEWQFYIRLLTEVEEEFKAQNPYALSVLRSEVARQYLFFAGSVEKEGYLPAQFLLHNYLHKGFRQDDSIDPVSYGWYYYQLNDWLHYCLEVFLWGLLSGLNEEDPPRPIRAYFKAITEEVLAKLNDITGKAFTGEEPFADLGLIPEETHLCQGELEKCSKNPLEHEAMARALIQLVKLYRENEEEIPFLEKIALHLGAFEQNGNVLQVFGEYVLKNLERPLAEAIENILFQIVNGHTQVAYRKLVSSGKNVIKLIVEEGRIQRVGWESPSYTSPRLGILTGFLQDLQLLGPKNELTERGEQQLKKLTT